MKTVIFGRHPHEIEEMVKAKGITLLDQNDTPDFVISYGGDGTFLLSECAYPGIPKLLLKSSMICKLCEPFQNEDILDRFIKGEYKTKKLSKLEAHAKGKILYGINDIIVHNADPRHAIRYFVSINGERMPKHEVIGDGVVVATPFGSTGYYKSITDGIFTSGIGIAFNNSTEQSDHVVLGEHDTITLSITRGPAMVYADNQEEFISLDVGDTIEIKKSKEESHIIRVE